MPLKYAVGKYIDEPCPTCQQPRRQINGAWLRHRREKAGKSLRQMARDLNLSAPYVSDIERQRRKCTASVLVAYEALQ